MLDCERLLWSLLARYGGVSLAPLIICMARGGAQCCLDYVSEGDGRLSRATCICVIIT